MKFNPMRRRIPLLKRAVPSFKRRLARLTSKNGFMLKKAHGALFLLRCENYVDRQIAFYDDYEERQLTALLAAMRTHGCELFIDVGANIGFYTVVVAKSGLAGRVIAFEPDARNRAQLGANLLLNHLQDRVAVRPEAVTSRSGPIGFRGAPETATGQSSVGDGEGSAPVPGIALDDVVDAEEQRVFVKIDVEGHELEVLAGMAELLRRNRVFLQVECFDAHAPMLVQTLGQRGLRQKDKIDNDFVFANF